MAMLLLQHGADVNERDEMLRTPLNICCQRGDVDMVEFLLRSGANASLAGDFTVAEASPVLRFVQTAPWEVACHQGHLAILKVLLKHQAAQGVNPDMSRGLSWAC